MKDPSIHFRCSCDCESFKKLQYVSILFAGLVSICLIASVLSNNINLQSQIQILNNQVEVLQHQVSAFQEEEEDPVSSVGQGKRILRSLRRPAGSRILHRRRNTVRLILPNLDSTTTTTTIDSPEQILQNRNLSVEITSTSPPTPSTPPSTPPSTSPSTPPPSSPSTPPTPPSSPPSPSTPPSSLPTPLSTPPPPPLSLIPQSTPPTPPTSNVIINVPSRAPLPLPAASIFRDLLEKKSLEVNASSHSNASSLQDITSSLHIDRSDDVVSVFTDTDSTSGASVYIRWGRHTCPMDSAIIYKGYMVGSVLSDEYANNVALNCLPTRQTWHEKDESNVTSSNMTLTNVVFSKEPDLAFTGQTIQTSVVRCVACLVSRSPAVMIPGRVSCPYGWRTEYSGYLMSSLPGAGREDFPSTSTYCVDDLPDYYYVADKDLSFKPKLSSLTGRVCDVEEDRPCLDADTKRKLSCCICTKAGF